MVSKRRETPLKLANKLDAADLSVSSRGVSGARRYRLALLNFSISPQQPKACIYVFYMRNNFSLNFVKITPGI